MYYYILATDATARSTFLPLCAEHDPFGVLLDVQGTNGPPTITLPDGFSFEMNASLEVDFSPYVDDADGDDLTLSCSGNINVLVSIDGLMVTLSAAPEWHGTEELTFSVSDGMDAAQDSVLVTVNLNYLAVPQVTITNPATGTLRIQWPAVPNASSYEVWSCAEPYGTYTYLGATANLFWEDTLDGQRMRFYQVIARDESITKKR
ncbi:MAG: Ig-like domain-containing protein [Candidatus Syntrophosphaera sp.]